MNPYFLLHCPCGCSRLVIVRDAKSGDYDIECSECREVVARLHSYALDFNLDFNNEEEGTNANTTP